MEQSAIIVPTLTDPPTPKREKSKDTPDPDEITPLKLREMSDKTFRLMTNTIPCMPQVGGD